MNTNKHTPAGIPTPANDPAPRLRTPLRLHTPDDVLRNAAQARAAGIIATHKDCDLPRRFEAVTVMRKNDPWPRAGTCLCAIDPRRILVRLTHPAGADAPSAIWAELSSLTFPTRNDRAEVA
ncbi:MAG: hypothetical protein ABID63_18460 [Pseudomonadota bacterium]